MLKNYLLLLLTLFLFEFCYSQELKTYTLDESLELLDKSEVLILDLQDEYFEEIPKSILQFKNLEQLFIGNNSALTVFPDFLGEFQKLWHLHIGPNEYTELPDNFGDLKKLEVLKISNTSIHKLPNNFVYLSSLKKLYLIKNEVTELPEDIGKLINLEQIIIQNDRQKLNKLPKSIGKLTHLRLFANKLKNYRFQWDIVKN